MYKITQPIVLPIADIINEGREYKTFVFDYQLNAKPGQYLMIWLPGVDLKPFAVAWQTDRQFAIIVLKIGHFTTELFKAKPGGFVGFTGPYGTCFNYEGKKKILLIGGGSGAPAVISLAQATRRKNIEVDFVLAAKTPEGIIYEDWLARQGVKVFHRFQNGKYEKVWDLIADLVKENNYDGIYACGPELLLKRIVDLTLTKDIFCQISMERYMKCGIGVCGKCCVDPLGICLCESGPVINSHLAVQITEFGRYHRDNSGQKIYFNQ